MKRGFVILVVVVLLLFPIVSAEVISFSDLFEKGRTYINIPMKEVYEIDESQIEQQTIIEDKSQTTSYFYAGSKLIASKNNNEIKYQYQDRLNSDINSKDLPFGQEINSDERFSFTGKELDNSGLYYFNARYYDSNIGRFTSIDPVKRNHPYSYVSNNPMNYVDPDGMDEIWHSWITVPNIAPDIITHQGEYPILPSEGFFNPAYPDSLVSGGQMEIDSGGPFTVKAKWRAPTTGSPVHHYELQLQLCEGCDPYEHWPSQWDDPSSYDLDWSVVVRARVKGVDEQDRSGPWTAASNSAVFLLPELQAGGMYRVEGNGVLIRDGDVGINNPGGDPLDPTQQSGSYGFVGGSGSPNPFNVQTTIEYEIPSYANFVSNIGIFDIQGRKVAELPTARSPGVHSVDFNPNDYNLPAGLYLANFAIDGRQDRIKINYIK